MDRKPEFVKQALLEQGLSEKTVPVNGEIWQRRDYPDPSGRIKMTPGARYADLRDLPVA
jgi:hypothetical protein